ncbi:MAG TPA: 4-(cytidine 5'-diphospho)-2-C-methyl-D-erythritol kinase [Gemmatimonadales bacterium]|nr:4-(cytidine 5'-diphospho)-2-C-methyl-D-erythritol kinase [Gemmatimonadales bacterium]
MTLPVRVRASACAKMNLWLRVFGRDAKGYHAIESLFQLISLADELVVERAAGGVTLAGAPPELGAVGENLVVRAATRFLAAARRTGGVHVTLTKRIPWNAGLGGASSDAAATLASLNRLFGVPLSAGDLLELAASLGSDVPCFLTGSALALGWGRGERLLALPALPARPVLVVPPPAPVRTADAYAWIDRDRGTEDTGEFAAVFRAEAFGSWAAVRSHSHNDFESVVSGHLPEIGHWLDRLRATDAFLVRLAGSGGAIVALYDSAPARDAAWARLGSDTAMLRAETLTAPPPVVEEA